MSEFKCLKVENVETIDLNRDLLFLEIAHQLKRIADVLEGSNKNRMKITQCLECNKEFEDTDKYQKLCSNCVVV